MSTIKVTLQSKFGNFHAELDQTPAKEILCQRYRRTLEELQRGRPLGNQSANFTLFGSKPLIPNPFRLRNLSLRALERRQLPATPSYFQRSSLHPEPTSRMSMVSFFPTSAKDAEADWSPPAQTYLDKSRRSLKVAARPEPQKATGRAKGRAKHFLDEIPQKAAHLSYSRMLSRGYVCRGLS